MAEPEGKKDDKKAEHHEPKGLPWGLPAFVFFLALAVGYGISLMAGALHSERNAIEWLISTFYRVLGPALILAIAAVLIRGLLKK